MYKRQALEKLGDHRAAGPYTGGKYSVYEGGTRTPFITYWRGIVKPAVSDEVVCTIDLASSLAALTAQRLPKDACLDSMNIIRALLGKEGAKGRDHLVQQNNGNNGTYALLEGDWKLHRYDRKTDRNVVVEQKLANVKVPPYLLFNLKEDPTESKNVITQHPQIAERMKEHLAEIITSEGTRPSR